MKNLRKVLFFLAIMAGMNALAANPTATIEKGTPQSATDNIWTSATASNISYASVGQSTGFSANWKGFWDDSNLYLLVTVNDADARPNTGGNGWNGDAAEVYIRPENGVALQIATTSNNERYKNADYFTSSVVKENGQIKYFFTIAGTKLYNFENKSLYLDFAIDYSKNGEATRESQYSWGENPYGNKNNPTATFGLVTLDEATYSVSIEALGNRTNIYSIGDFACLVATVDARALSDQSLTYEWRKDGVKYTGKNYNNNNIRPTAAGTYTCVITYNNGKKSNTSNAIVITTTTNNDQYLRNQEKSTNLPILVIRTGNTKLPSWEKTNHCGASCTPANTKIPVDMKVIWNGEGVTNSLTDMANNANVYYDRKARINYRGSTSRTMAKKNFALSTCKKDLDENGDIVKGKTDMFGLPEGKDWVLYAAYQDKSMMRNRLAMHLANTAGYYASATKYVELYIDGEYWGVYVFMEKYDRDENRINITKQPTANPDGSATGYILKFDKVNLSEEGTWYRGNINSIRNLPCLDGTCYQSNYTGCGSHGGCGDAAASSTKQGWEIVYPDPKGYAQGTSDLTVKEFEYIQNFLTNMELALYYASNDETYDAVFEEYIDLQSFADFMLMEEFARNTDGYRASMWFSKDVGGKLKCVAPWDFEMGYGNSRTHGGSLTNIWQHMYNASESCNSLNFGDSEPYYPIPFWWEKLKQSNCFKKMLKTRWETLRATTFTKEAIWNGIDNMVAELNASNAVKREMSRWPWATRNTCVTGCKTPAYNNCPWIILPWGDTMKNSNNIAIHPMPTNMPEGFSWGEYTSDNGGRKTLTFDNEYMLLKGWIADRLLGMDKLIADLNTTSLNENDFADCAHSPAYQFTIATSNDITEICSNGEQEVTLSIEHNIVGTYELSYQWKKDGVEIAGATSDNYTTNQAGNYTCEISISYLGGIPTLYQNYTASKSITDKNCATIVAEIESDEEIVNIIIYNVLGNEIDRCTTLDEMKDRLKPGVNIVRVETTKDAFVKKLLVK